jgi:hypothetical protein
MITFSQDVAREDSSNETDALVTSVESEELDTNNGSKISFPRKKSLRPDESSLPRKSFKIDVSRVLPMVRQKRRFFKEELSPVSSEGALRQMWKDHNENLR